MRNRLVAALVGMTVAVIALYGIPRAFVLADLVNSQEERKLERSVDQLAALIGEREAGSRPVTGPYLEQFLFDGESVEYVAADGTAVTAGQKPEDQGIAESRPVTGGGEVTLRRVGSLIEQRVARAVLPLALLGGGLVIASVGVGWLLARRLARPFQELARAATRLGSGQFELELREYSVPEAQRIAEELSRSARQLDELVRHERDHAINASHELRSPVTALRLQMEDLAMWPKTPPEVAAELRSYVGELDRLSEAIDRHLDTARARRERQAVEMDLRALLEDAALRWSDLARAAGRRLALEQGASVRILLDPAAVRQILDALIENALDDGEGTITMTATDTSSYVIVSVADEGTRRMESDVFHLDNVSGANKLGAAAEVAEAMGGRLSLDHEPTNTFTLRLPKRAGAHQVG